MVGVLCSSGLADMKSERCSSTRPNRFFFFFFNLKMSEREERCRVDGSTEGGRG